MPHKPHPSKPRPKSRELQPPAIPGSVALPNPAEDVYLEALAESTLTSKGQVTIPQSIRSMYHLDAGDSLVWRRDKEGRLMVEPKRTLTIEDIWAAIEVAGAPVSTRAATDKDMEEAIGQVLGAKHGRH
jgi:AbrB family looped-hinge helix DNA binding protein